MELKINKDNWVKVKLLDVFIKKEENDKENACNRFDRFLKVEHMDAESLHIKRWASQGNGDELNPYFYKIFRKGQILFPTRNPHLRRTVLASFDGICGEKTLTLEPIEKYLVPEFIPFLFHSESFYAHTTGAIIGSTNPHVRWRDVANYEFLLPPKDQQAKLAELLWAMDEVIERERVVLEKAEISKFTFIEELLTGSTRLDYFDKPWQRYRIDELAKYRRGSFPQPYGSKEWYDDINGSPFVQVYDIDYDLKLKVDTKAKISDKAKPMSVFVPQGTLIISIQGSIGRVAVTQYDAYVDRTILIFQEFLKEIDFNYFTYAIQRIFKIAERTAPGATIKTITKEALSGFEIDLPSFEEQKLIGERLKLLDQSVFEINGKIEVSQSLQKSLINQIF